MNGIQRQGFCKFYGGKFKALKYFLRPIKELAEKEYGVDNEVYTILEYGNNLQ